MRRLFLATALITLAGCGGSGGGLLPLAPGVVQFGLVSSKAPTTATFAVYNRFPVPATVTELAVTGPFTIDAGQLPLTLQPTQGADISVTFTPPGVGSYLGAADVNVETPGQTESQSASFEAEAEAANLSIDSGDLDYGDVLPDTTTEVNVSISNLSAMSAVTLTGATYPDGAFSFTGAPFPMTVAPGTTEIVPLRYAPVAPGAPNGLVTLETDADNGPHEFNVTATTGGREIIDFGTVTFQGDGNTPEMTFDVAGDATGFMIEAFTNPTTTLGLRLLEGPGGKDYENLTLTGPYLWTPGQEIFVALLPRNDDPNVQLVPGGGTYKLRLFQYAGSAPTVDVRVIIQRRPAPATQTITTLDLNIFLANAITPTAATASTDGPLQQVITKIDEVLGQQGIRIGDIDYYDVTDPAYDDVTIGEFGPMLRLSSAATETRLNLFFVRTALGGGVLGVAPALGGPFKNGTVQSGVMSRYRTTNTDFTGLVAAHEIGHFVGLAHTQETNGSYDDILDTDECPACNGPGGGYLMHWQALGVSNITDGQGIVARAWGGNGARLAPPPPLRALQSKPRLVHVDPFISKNWCGTCNLVHSKPKGR